MLLPASVAGDELADIQEKGQIVFGADTTYPPFEFISEKTDKPIGFSVDLGIKIAEQLNVSAAFKTSTWDGIIPNLRAQEFDAILSSMTITVERSIQVSFSTPYFNSSQAILVADGNPKGINGPADLLKSGVVVGVQLGTTSDAYITNTTKPDSEIVRTEGFDELYQKLDIGDVDVILGDAPVVGYAATTGSVSGEVVGTFGDVEPFGIAVRVGEGTTLTAINNAIAKLFKDGTYDNIAECWFGYRPLHTTAPASNDCNFGEVKYITDKSSAPVDTFAFLGGMTLIATLALIKKRRT